MSARSTSHSSAYYAADVAEFIATSPDTILGSITASSAFAIDATQRDAWVAQTEVLKRALEGVNGKIFLEFNVPRIGSRIDAVLISGPAIFVIEFKVGETGFNRDDLNQVWDYALDLKNFHKASHNAPVIPILVATHAPWSDTVLPESHADKVSAPVRCNSKGLRQLIRAGLDCSTGDSLDGQRWSESPYQPTPTIIEAAQTLFAQHSVDVRYLARAVAIRAAAGGAGLLLSTFVSRGRRMSNASRQIVNKAWRRATRLIGHVACAVRTI